MRSIHRGSARLTALTLVLVAIAWGWSASRSPAPQPAAVPGPQAPSDARPPEPATHHAHGVPPTPQGTRTLAPRVPLPAICELRHPLDTSGFFRVAAGMPPWNGSSLPEIAKLWDRAGYRMAERLEAARTPPGDGAWVHEQLSLATLYHYEGDVAKAEATLDALYMAVAADPALARRHLATIVYFQGITALRRGENENCVACGEATSCLVPIKPGAVHVFQSGSREAIERFSELLERFPNDLEVKWLLNLAYMTVGEWPLGVPPLHRLPLEGFFSDQPGMGAFKDVSQRVGLERWNEAGGAVLSDFDGDGWLDAVFSCFNRNRSLAVYRNRRDGTFEDRTATAGVTDQLGGLYCVQADYDNDGACDLFVARGAWLNQPIRPSLLRNLGDGTFTDVTQAAGLATPLNSNSASWADYDNDGHLDLFVCCERQRNRLYRNRGNGTFEEVAERARVGDALPMCKGATWIDYDNDDWPDLFVNVLKGMARLYHNERDGTFSVASRAMPPPHGFSCWTFDYDNDGWLDIFATCYDRTMSDVVKGLMGARHGLPACCLWRNKEGHGFEDRALAAGLDGVYAAMGSNFADFDGDGWLDMYLGTGEPQLGSLMPNRMFKGVEGKRFLDVTSVSRTGHLQKGHGVACGDWDRDGDVDLLVQTGGAVPGDRYHNLLFENPGHGNRWITLRLVGVQTNRAAIGARIKVKTAAQAPLTLHRHVTSGSSFGANPLEQTIGLARCEKIERLEIHWPTSGTTQVFRDVPVDCYLDIVEFADAYRLSKRPPSRYTR